MIMIAPSADHDAQELFDLRFGLPSSRGSDGGRRCGTDAFTATEELQPKEDRPPWESICVSNRRHGDPLFGQLRDDHSQEHDKKDGRGLSK